MSQNRARRFHWAANLIAFAGAANLLRWWWLARPLWVDEEMIALNARWRSFADLAGPLWLDQTAPLGWLALERLALVTFGADERAARALPTAFGIATLAVAVWIGRRWMTPVGAAVLVALCSIAPWVVFFTLELKHYSADTCWALLLPALAGWAVEAPRADCVVRRTALWWAAAAVGSWLSNGATFVVPASAILLAGWILRQYGVRDAARAATYGAVWAVAFGLQYVLALRHALGNAYLENYWSFAFPPVSDGIVPTLAWVRQWLEAFAVKPVGTGSWLLFWGAAITGFVFAAVRHGLFGLAFAAVPVSALALGILQIVPPFERLGLWCVPPLYVGLAACADAAVWGASQKQWRWPVIRLGAASAVFLVAGSVSLDIARNGINELRARKPDNNYGLNDRRAVERVRGLRKPGDPILTTHFGLAGLWWYSGVNISDPDAGAYLGNSPIFEITHETRKRRCAHYRAVMDEVLQRTGRAVLYLGFRMNVEPEGFDRLVFDELARRGATAGYGRYAELSHVAAFDFRQPPDGASDRFFTNGGSKPAPPLRGCVAIRPARRW